MGVGIEHLKSQVKWRDLLKLSPWERFIENSLCWPPLMASLALLYFDYYWLAAPVSALYFLSAMRQCHNGYHSSLGVSQTKTDITLIINSAFMLTALHSVKVNHIEHHKHNLSHEDYERRISDMPWWRCLLHGPAHWWHNHYEGFKLGTRQEKTLITLELVLIFGLITSAFISSNPFLLFHVSLMGFAQLMTPFFTIWITHHGHDENSVAHIRRNKWLNLITMNMLLHYEHHLFPAVPAIKLGELMRRMEEVEEESLE